VRGILVILAAVLASLVLAACGPSAYVPPPTQAGDEMFQVTTRSGNLLTDDEYRAFYSSVVDSLGADRSDLIVSIALGARGSTITAVAVTGHAGRAVVGPLVASAFDGGRPAVESTIAGRQVLVLDGRGLVVAYAGEAAVFVVESFDSQQIERIVAALER
jgi:hypothetical protein